MSVAVTTNHQVVSKPPRLPAAALAAVFLFFSFVNANAKCNEWKDSFNTNQGELCFTNGEGDIEVVPAIMALGPCVEFGIDFVCTVDGDIVENECMAYFLEKKVLLKCSDCINEDFCRLKQLMDADLKEIRKDENQVKSLENHIKFLVKKPREKREASSSLSIRNYMDVLEKHIRHQRKKEREAEQIKKNRLFLESLG